MSTELQNLKNELTTLDNQYSLDDFNLVAKTSFLPRLQLCTAASEVVKNEQVSMNNFAIIPPQKADPIVLGKEVDVLLVNWRIHALDLSDRENIRSSFQPKSELFQEIKATADSKVPNNGCMYGPEYLIYVPQEKMWVTFFMGGETTRNEARNVHSFAYRKDPGEETAKFHVTPITLKSRRIEGKNNTWWSPFATKCSTPFDLPSTEECLSMQQEFLNTKEVTGLEKAEPEEITR